MNKTFTNLIKGGLLALSMMTCNVMFAQSVVASGGTSSDTFSCTVGEVAASETAGLWAAAVEVPAGIDAVLADGEVVVTNSAADRTLTVKMPDSYLVDGAYYTIYSFNGMVLERDQIGYTPFTVGYGHLLENSCIIFTVDTPRGTVATFKIFK